MEVLVRLLDSLHETLNVGNNTVPSPELAPQGQQRPDMKEASEKAWQVFLQRHSSFVVRMLYGQLLSVSKVLHLVS